MSDRKIYAVIVSYNGGSELAQTVRSILGQVDRVLVVDNGSVFSTVDLLRAFESSGEIDLIRLEDNRGIAYAQNVGISAAVKDGAAWVLTLDQDSACANDMVSKLLVATQNIDRGDIGFCCPRIDYGRSAGEEGAGGVVEDIQYAISSGCLFPVESLQNAGAQRDEYFIDSVDFEYCLRLRARGYRLLRVGDAVLRHRLGTTKRLRFLGFGFSLSVHAPFRRYYLFRNHLFLMRAYWSKFPLFLIKKTIFLFLLLGQIVFFEDKKIENLREIFHGLLDAARGISGKNFRKASA